MADVQSALQGGNGLRTVQTSTQGEISLISTTLLTQEISGTI